MPIDNTHCMSCINLKAEAQQLKSNIRILKVKVKRMEKAESQMVNALAKATESHVMITTGIYGFSFI